MAHPAMRQSSPNQVFARTGKTPLDAGILTYEFPQSVSEIYPPGGESDCCCDCDDYYPNTLKGRDGRLG